MVFYSRYTLKIIMIFCIGFLSKIDSTAIAGELTQSRGRQRVKRRGIGNLKRTRSECVDLERKFHSEVEASIAGNLSTAKNDRLCLQEGNKAETPGCDAKNKQKLNQLKEFRRLLKRAYKAIAQDWVSKNARTSGGLATQCFSPKGKAVAFTENIRDLKAYGDSQACKPLQTKWNHGLDSRFTDFINQNPRPSGFRKADIAKLKSYNISFIKRNTPASVIYGKKVSNKKLYEGLSTAYASFEESIKKVQGHVTGLSKKRGQLYGFENAFESFVKSSNPAEKEKALACRDSSGFGADCGTQTGRGSLTACLSRTWKTATEFLPVLPVLDSLHETGLMASAVNAGLLTAEQFDKKRSELILKGLAGFSGLGGAGSLLTKGVRKTLAQTQQLGDIAAITRAVSKPSGRGLATESVQSSSQRVSRRSRRQNRSRSQRRRKQNPARAQTSVYKSFNKRYSQKDQDRIRSRNRGLPIRRRFRKIERHLGIELTPAQKTVIRDVHEKRCKQIKCTAKEIREIKNLAVVRNLFKDLEPQKVKDLYRMNLLGGNKSSDDFSRLLALPAFKTDTGTFDARGNLQKKLEDTQAALKKLSADPNASAIQKSDLENRVQAQAQALKNLDVDAATGDDLARLMTSDVKLGEASTKYQGGRHLLGETPQARPNLDDVSPEDFEQLMLQPTHTSRKLSVSDYVDAVIQKATSSADKIQSLQKQADAALASGNTKVYSNLQSQIVKLQSQKTPLSPSEARAIGAVIEGFNPEQMARRIPLEVDSLGRVILPKGGGAGKVGFTKDELADFEQIKEMINIRNASAQSEKDVPLFEAVKKINPDGLLTQRISRRQKELSNSMVSFTDGKFLNLPKTPSFEKYKPTRLSQSLGPKGTNTNAKKALESLHDVLTAPAQRLTDENLTKLKASLSTLRAPILKKVISENKDLSDLLDFAAQRAGHRQLEDLKPY